MACLTICPTHALQLATVGAYLRPEGQPVEKGNQ
jgi:hypothetical protein